jgi:cyclopropane-fatty-acyl-phospholipid synthase
MYQESAIRISESGLLPDLLLRFGIRRLLSQRLRQIAQGDLARSDRQEQTLLALMRQGPIAEVPDLANEQHYEVPAAFFEKVLGDYCKYSCAYWEPGTDSLNQAEAAALSLTCDHAALRDGQRILELGCGWGALTLYMAQRYPHSQITAVSNSASQGDFIRARLQAAGLQNVQVITADMNDFDTREQFDRVVSVEMFEHMRNWERLMANIARWLAPEGKLFVHIFVHRDTPYLFQDKDSSDWMSRHFFSGGMMPSATLPLRCQTQLRLAHRWHWPGDHYAKTCRAWLRNMDQQKRDLRPLFEQTYGTAQASLWWQRWRMFFMACEELFAYRNGREWFVAHYQFDKQALR